MEEEKAARGRNILNRRFGIFKEKSNFTILVKWSSIETLSSVVRCPLIVYYPFKANDHSFHFRFANTYCKSLHLMLFFFEAGRLSSDKQPTYKKNIKELISHLLLTLLLLACHAM